MNLSLWADGTPPVVAEKLRILADEKLGPNAHDAERLVAESVLNNVARELQQVSPTAQVNVSVSIGVGITITSNTTTAAVGAGG